MGNSKELKIGALFVRARFDEFFWHEGRRREEDDLASRGGNGFVVISVCIMSRTVLLRGKIPRETMQDTRANMGAHLKWDIPMFLGIASTKDGRGPSTDHVVNPAQYLSRLRKAFVPRLCDLSFLTSRHRSSIRRFFVRLKSITLAKK